jgi:hypothetical protein
MLVEWGFVHDSTCLSSLLYSKSKPGSFRTLGPFITTYKHKCYTVIPTHMLFVLTVSKQIILSLHNIPHGIR